MGAEPITRLDELLTHAGWLRALAARLVHDPAGAEDLVQEAWVVALTREPRPGSPLRPWLARVVRNLASNRRRAEERRSEHEGAARPPGAAKSAEEVVAELEAQRALVEALLQLEEPLRGTIVLRYYRGLDSRQIARIQGVAAGTVRWRLKRGIEELRARLDARFGGSRSSWCLLLEPLALAKLAAVGSTSAGAGGALAPGALAMSLSVKVSAAAAILGIACGLWWFQASQQPDDSLERAPAMAVASQLGSPPSMEPSDPQPSTSSADRKAMPLGSTPTGADSAEQPCAYVTGKVVGRDALPIPGAVVVLRSEPKGYADALTVLAQLGAPDVQTVESDASGAFRLCGQPGRTLCVVHAPGHAPKAIHDIYASTDVVTDLGALELAPSCLLTARVVTAEGSPVANAEILLAEGWDKAIGPYTRDERLIVTRTDAAGRFSIPSPGAGELRVVVASGAAPWMAATLHCASSRSAEEVIHLHRHAPLFGRVTGLEHYDSPDAFRVRIEARWAGENGPSVPRASILVPVNQDGTFTCSEVPLDAEPASVDLQVVRSIGTASSLPVSERAQVARFGNEIVLDACLPATLAFALADVDGTPIDAFEASFAGSPLASSMLVRRDAGLHEARGVPGLGGPFRLRIEAPNYLTWESELLKLSPDERRDLGTVSLELRRRLVVCVTTGLDRLPLPGVEVFAARTHDDVVFLNNPGARVYGPRIEHGVTDERGWAEIHASDRPLRVTTRHADHAPAVPVEVEPDEESVEIQLEPGATVRVHVTDGFGKPLPGAPVRRSGSGTASEIARILGTVFPDVDVRTTDASGLVVFDHLPPGEHQFSIVTRMLRGQSDTERFSATIPILGNEAAELTLVRPPEYELRGRLFIDGSPAPGVQVFVLDPSLPNSGLPPVATADQHISFGTHRATAETDGAGAFSVEALRSGTYVLRFDTRSLRLPYQTVLGHEPPSSEVVLDVERGSIHGTVRDGEGRGMGGLNVAVYRRSDRERVRGTIEGWGGPKGVALLASLGITALTRTDPGGVFLLDSLPCGTEYDVSVMNERRELEHLALETLQNRGIRADVRIDTSAGGVVEVHVEGELRGIVRVVARHAPSISLEKLVKRGAPLIFEGLVPGEWTFQVEEGFFDFTLVPGSVRVVEVTPGCHLQLHCQLP